MTTSFYSNGKLLITGEYLVLDGALSLAIPTIYGQSLTVRPISEKQLVWKSLDERGRIWFGESYKLHASGEDDKLFEITTLPIDNKGSVPTSENRSVSDTLSCILTEARKLNPQFLTGNHGYEVTTSLNFPRDWGLGSSSTLINNIAQWAKIDAYALLWNSFGGSGYDIACARHNTPITYQLKDEQPKVSHAPFYPPYKNELYFIHLNKKQNSKDGIAHYKGRELKIHAPISQINSITQRILTSTKLPQFEKLITKHEDILSEILNVPPVKQRLFPDFKGAIKSLGAWGGDFIIATGNKNTPQYFNDKGFSTVIPYSRMAR